MADVSAWGLLSLEYVEVVCVTTLTPHFQDETTTVYHGDCTALMPLMDADSVDAVVTDPPYHLVETTKRFANERAERVLTGQPGVFQRHSKGFMGKTWDGGDVAFRPETWAAALRVLKPGGHLVAFGGSRTWHRIAVAIEDAGFEIRDCLMWLYGSGFPKSLDVSKALDKMAGAEREVLAEGKPVKRLIPGATQNATGSWIKDNGREYVPTETEPATDTARQWDGWGTALKPAFEPIILARKPLAGSVAQNVTTYGVGAINVNGCRIAAASGCPARGGSDFAGDGGWKDVPRESNPAGRWPANVVLDEDAAALLDDASGTLTSGANPTRRGSDKFRGVYSAFAGQRDIEPVRGLDIGGASRFFYTAKASQAERQSGTTHPTVKPTSLMRWLCRLVTPPGGRILDPFAGTGSTRLGALAEGFRVTLIEREAEYLEQLCRRAAVLPLFLEPAS